MFHPTIRLVCKTSDDSVSQCLLISCVLGREINLLFYTNVQGIQRWETDKHQSNRD